MVKKIKLRDLTVTQYENWVEENCGDSRCCDDCLFDKAQCCIGSLNCWIKNKDLYSDRFLDQEVLIEENDFNKSTLLTNDEMTILRNIDKRYKYIARDKNDCLCIYSSKPYKLKEDNMWIFDTTLLNDGSQGSLYTEFDLFNHLFKFIKWEDNEPYSIEELIK